MTAAALKESLLHIAENVDNTTSIEDVFKELAFIADVDEAEQQEAHGQIIAHHELKSAAKHWAR